MIFTLEALQAKHGDALLLHYGKQGKQGKAPHPQLVVIDGGPAGVFPMLKKRLDDLKELRNPDQPLPIRLVMISHIDDDHIRGVLDLTEFLLKVKETKAGGTGALPYEITNFWHNSFDDVVGGLVHASVATVASVEGASADAVMANLPVEPQARLVLESVNQGRRLRDNAAALQLNINQPFGGLVSVPSERNPAKLGDLRVTVVGPNQQRIDALKREWEKKVATLPKNELRAEAAAYVDRSVSNLSSIVVLVELGDKRMLLTGDARGDFILEDLQAQGLLDHDGRMHVDLLKVPHHGSEHNVEEDFFRRVTADHYLISADGKHHNPDAGMLRMLSRARGSAAYTIHLTNRVPHAVEFLESDAKGKAYTVVWRSNGADSVCVDLLDPLTG